MFLGLELGFKRECAVYTGPDLDVVLILLLGMTVVVHVSLLVSVLAHVGCK